MRIASAFGGILTVLFYTIAQMVGAGNLIRLLFGIPYEWAVTGVGIVMLAYVLFGGMIATTWVQIIKAVLLLFGVSAPDGARARAVRLLAGALVRGGGGPLRSGGARAWRADHRPARCGLARARADARVCSGLPHILMRFYTVPDARAARTSVLYATGFIGYFYLIIPIVGFGASALVGRDIIAQGRCRRQHGGAARGRAPRRHAVPRASSPRWRSRPSSRSSAGLTLAGASALSHDIFVHVIRRGHATEHEQIRVARVATVVFGALAVLLGIVFKGQNVAFMVGLAFAIACSANFPPLLLSIVWKRFTTAGAVSSIVTGAVLSVLLIVLSPTVWVDIFHNPQAIFPLRNPAIVSMPAAFLVGIVASLIAREPTAEAMFDDEKIRTYLGVGAE